MKRCYQCNGRFGLIRHRFALKQFCSKNCVIKYRANVERRRAPITVTGDHRRSFANNILMMAVSKGR